MRPWLIGLLALAACSSPANEADAEMAQAMRSQTAMVRAGTDLGAIFSDCTQDCAGHKAGYLWALDQPQVFEDDCDPTAGESFHHGCQMGARAAAWE